MAIILEGPDNAGKSTLAKALSEATGLPIVAASEHLNHDNAADLIELDLSNMLKNVIMDRSHIISDSIYGQICRKQSIVELRHFAPIMQAYTEAFHNCMFIFCDAPDSVLGDMSTHVIKPHETVEHINQVKRNKEALANEYRVVFGGLRNIMSIYKVDPRKETLAMIDFVKDILN